MTLGETRAAPTEGSEARAIVAIDFRAVFEQIASPCLLLSPEAPGFRVVAVTEAYLTLARTSRAQCVGAPVGDLLQSAGIVVDEAALEALRATLARATLQRSTTRLHFEASQLPAPGSGEVPARAAWNVVHTPVLSTSGEVTHVLQRFERVDARPERVDARPESLSPAARDLERQLGERTRELAAASAELEAFSYSVAHDLRAPLRAIDGFSQALAQDHAAALGADGSSYLERIRAGAQRMSTLLDDMLELSRIQRLPLRKTRLDVSELARRIIDALRRTSPERVVAVDIAPQLSVVADAHLTTVLLEKLLGNAWKFTSKNSRASIELGREPSAERTLFVADDGVGFDMTSAARLFSPFQRLHKAADFDGTGMGLAIAHRIVVRHGGRIWARSEVGKGARFHWTLELDPDSGPRL